MDWSGYDVFDPEVDRPLAEATPKEARRHFEKLMAERPERRAQLAALLERDGVVLGTDDAAISALDHWFREHVEPHPARAGLMVEEWYSVANDIALHLGEVAIARSPALRWELFTAGRTNASFQRPVLMGFAVKNPKFNVDLDANLLVIGHRAVAGEALDDEELVPMLAAIAERAGGRS